MRARIYDKFQSNDLFVSNVASINGWSTRSGWLDVDLARLLTATSTYYALPSGRTRVSDLTIRKYASSRRVSVDSPRLFNLSLSGQAPFS